MKFLNAEGLPIIAANEQAALAFDNTVAAYAGFRRDIGAQLKACLAADPDMPMAHVLKGLLFQFMALPALAPRAAAALSTAHEAMARRDASPRERAHAAGLQAWIDGRLQHAVDTYEAVLQDHPRDFLALKLANFFHFYLGDSQAMRASVERRWSNWSAADANFGFVASLYAFGLEETSAYAQAEPLARLAVDRNPCDGWGIHTVAHVCEAQQRHQEGIQWLVGTAQNWDTLNNFRYHLWWHQALHHLAAGDTASTLRLYDERLWDSESSEYLDLCNDISLLQRLELAGVDVGARWQPLADRVAPLCSLRCFSFIDVHYMLALAAAGRFADVRALQVGLQRHAEGSGTTAAQITAAIGLPACEALMAYRSGDAQRAAALLAPLRNTLHRLGGSHAQRALFDAILADAQRRSDSRQRPA